MEGRQELGRGKEENDRQMQLEKELNNLVTFCYFEQNAVPRDYSEKWPENKDSGSEQM